MLVNTNAIVISALKYGEADLIVKCFTKESGLKTYLLRGILKSKRGKFKTSMFQPLSQLELQAKHKDKGTLEYLQDAKILLTYKSLHTNIVKSSMVLFISEVLKNSVQEEEKNEELYVFLEQTLQWLDENDQISNFHLLFMLKLSRFLGFYPEDSDTEKFYFNMLDGVFQDIKTNSYCIEGQNLVILKQLLGLEFETIQNLKLSQINRNYFLEMMLLYYQLHIETFKKPKSLAVLHEIFN